MPEISHGIELAFVPTLQIDPSPYQVRKHFDENALHELSQSIMRDGLIEPIVLRRIGERYELIAGERRLRAIRLGGIEKILSRIVEATDLQARRMAAAENMQRQDLSPIEVIEAIVEIVDSELIEDKDYAEIGVESIGRVKTVLAKLDADERHKTDYFAYKFIGKIDAVFTALPKPIQWRSFFLNDLPLITNIDEEIRTIAIEHKLNKSQTKELIKLKEEAPIAYTVITETGYVQPTRDLWELPTDEEGQPKEPIPLREVSGSEFRRIRRHAKADPIDYVTGIEVSQVKMIARNWMATLTDAKESIKKDIDRLQIIIESINREGGFEQLTEQWQWQDTRLFYDCFW
jgi:ParB/RepB/Spo0J family partition protein